MNDHLNDNNDSESIVLPRARRATFRNVPMQESPWSPEAPKPRQSILDAVNTRDPDGVKYYESLMIGDVVQIPVPAYSEEGEKIQGDLDHEAYTVKSISYANDRYEANVISEDGIEESISADFVRDGAVLEARIAERLLTRDGLDILNILEDDNL